MSVYMMPTAPAADGFVASFDAAYSVFLTFDDRFFGPFYVKPETGGPAVPTTGQLWPR